MGHSNSADGFVTATKAARSASQKESNVMPLRCGSRLPFCGSVGSEFPQGESGDEMALKIESIVDSGMHAEEALSGPS
jgi:hypothetical protein